jgi:hypothetical protein
MEPEGSLPCSQEPSTGPSQSSLIVNLKLKNGIAFKTSVTLQAFIGGGKLIANIETHE